MCSEKTLEVFGTSVRLGEKLHKQIQVGELANGSPVYIPLMVLRGRRPGPVLWLCGAAHGDELNGIFAMREVYLNANTEEIQGALVFTPILNSMAFVERRKVSFLDLLDMESQFPGKAEGLITERMAFQIFRQMKKVANAVINFHTMGPINHSFPYTVSKIVSEADPEVIEKAFQMALAFGVKANCRVDLRTTKDELPGRISGSLDATCLQNGIPAIMPEVGAGGRWEKVNVSTAERGIYNVMRFLGILEGEPDRAPDQIVIPRRKWLRTNRGGVAQVLFQPGDIVPKGTVYARILNMWDTLEELRAEEDMYLIGVISNPVVSSGDRIGFGGFGWHAPEET